LSAIGEPQTAKNIADVKPMKINPLLKLQRIVFLPFSLIGMLISVVAEHFKTRRKGYISLFKSLFTLALAIGTFTFLISIYQLNRVQLFPWPLAWLITLAVMFLLVIGWVKYMKKYYLTATHKPIDKRLKTGSVLSALILMTSLIYFFFATYNFQQEQVKKSFNLVGKQLTLNFNEKRPQDHYFRSVNFQIRSSDLLSEEVLV
jgi:MFS family permease